MTAPGMKELAHRAAAQAGPVGKLGRAYLAAHAAIELAQPAFCFNLCPNYGRGPRSPMNNHTVQCHALFDAINGDV